MREWSCQQCFGKSGRGKDLAENNHVSLWSVLGLRIQKGGRKYQKHRAKDAALKETLGNILPLPLPRTTDKKTGPEAFIHFPKFDEKFPFAVYIFGLEFPCQPLPPSPRPFIQEKVGISHSVSLHPPSLPQHQIAKIY